MNIKDPRRRRAYEAAAREQRKAMQDLKRRGYTLAQIGKLHGVTKQRVSQILTSAP